MSEIRAWTSSERGVGRSDGGATPRPDLTGFAVEATDGHIGSVDEASFDSDARGCIVVDTGFWIFGKKRLIPAGFVSDVDEAEKKVFLTCTMGDVKGTPDYDAERRDHERPLSPQPRTGSSCGGPRPAA